MKVEQTDRCVIEIEDWQIQCCGTPFKIGDEVDWIVHIWVEVMGVSQSVIDYYYEHHSSEWNKLFKIKGVVEKIEALYYSLELHPNPSENHGCTHHRINKKTVNVIEANVFEKDINGLEFGNYIVVLRDYDIRPAEKEEVMFT